MSFIVKSTSMVVSIPISIPATQTNALCSLCNLLTSLFLATMCFAFNSVYFINCVNNQPDVLSEIRQIEYDRVTIRA